ncbi:hypothetical protein IAC76_03735 [Spirochaetes bacterium]|uniref:4Fe-4S domain-containing protein n=1 Tax=Candidatus Scatousia excrementipullorum TaxID=2840936 RepID=A0A9D9GZH2_9BACT|nr:hypothetical protein [Candidatus Scatousia excrementipullorum]
MELSGLQIFKYLPAAKKAEHSNRKECGCPTCMAFALKLAKKQIELSKCSYAPDELKEFFEINSKQPQKTVEINGLKIGGENVLYRHEKTFVNRTAIAVIVDLKDNDWQKKLERLTSFEITRVSETMKIDLVILKNNTSKFVPSGINFINYEDFERLPFIFLEDDFSNTKEKLVEIRTKAVLEKDDACSSPVCVRMKTTDELSQCARAAYYLCKYANILVFENFNEAMISSLMTLRQNIFTDPQKPLQVESKIYEFNNPDENSLIFMTTNFALTFFAVANELEGLNVPSYLIVTPADGMSVLTAWSAEKFTAKMVANTLKKWDFANRVKNRKIIIPGLLAHMKEELEEEIKDFEIVVGTVEAYAIGDFVKEFQNRQS